MVGKNLSHYRILEEVGRGGMGVVYKAHDKKLDRPVALKFPSPSAIGSEREKERFVREAQAAAALSHPNIATVYE
ncbi:MAG: protein kinase, partial [Bacteroidota bacterium]